jgi:hypothetical protein
VAIATMASPPLTFEFQIQVVYKNHPRLLQDAVELNGNPKINMQIHKLVEKEKYLSEKNVIQKSIPFTY